MYSLGVLCLLSAAVALPTPPQVHSHLPALAPPKAKIGIVKNAAIPISHGPELPPLEKPVKIEKPEGSKKPLEFPEKPKEEKEIEKEKVVNKINVIEKPKDSKEFKDSKELKGQEPKDSKEHKHSKEESKEKDYNSIEEAKDSKEYDSRLEQLKNSWWSILEGLISKLPLPSIPSWFPFRSRGRSYPDQDQEDTPIYVVKESDYDFE